MGEEDRSVRPAASRRVQRLLSLATVGYTVALVIATHYPRPQEILLRLGADEIGRAHV